MFTQLSHFYGLFICNGSYSIDPSNHFSCQLSFRHIFYRYVETNGWACDGNWSWKTAGYYNCILLSFWIKNRFFHELVALFIVLYSSNNNSCAFWIPYHSQLCGCCNSVSLVRFHITMSNNLAYNLIMLIDTAEHIGLHIVSVSVSVLQGCPKGRSGSTSRSQRVCR